MLYGSMQYIIYRPARHPLGEICSLVSLLIYPKENSVYFLRNSEAQNFVSFFFNHCRNKTDAS